MSERYDFILVYVERFIGVILTLIGIALTYNTYTNQSAAGWAYGYFTAIGVILTILGLAMTLVKTR
jgi:xanthine/uracil/vitamin C permease (AzgA family)